MNNKPDISAMREADFNRIAQIVNKHASREEWQSWERFAATLTSGAPAYIDESSLYTREIHEAAKAKFIPPASGAPASDGREAWRKRMDEMTERHYQNVRHRLGIAIACLKRIGKDINIKPEQARALAAKTAIDLDRATSGAPLPGASRPEPISMVLHCPDCRTRHIDVGEFATKPHHTHACQSCGLTWRPAVVHTVGVQFLPGFKNEATNPNSGKSA